MKRPLALIAMMTMGCSKPGPAETVAPGPVAEASAPVTEAAADAGDAVIATPYTTAEDAFRAVLAEDPLVLAVGEAHAQKGSENIASSTKRFTDTLLPLVAPKASDVVVELWAPNPKCVKEVKAVASAQKPVVAAQAETNQNEYVMLGTAAKKAGVTPWLLEPSCEQFADLADAGADAVGAMLTMVKRLTAEKITRLHQKNPTKIVVAYGGAMHNDLKGGEWSFGPELDRLTKGRYVELDLIVPEYVKKTDAWRKMPWYDAFMSQPAARREQPVLYKHGERSYTLVFAAAPPRPGP